MQKGHTGILRSDHGFDSPQYPAASSLNWPTDSAEVTVDA